MKDKFNLLVCQIVVVAICFFVTACASIDGYCEALPSYTPDSSSLQVIEGGGMPYYYGMQGYNEMFFMSPEFDQSMNEFGASCEDWLQEHTGYTSDQLITMAPQALADKIDEAGFGSGHPSTGLSQETAQWLANRLSNGILQGATLASANYKVLRQAVPQWGRNAYQYFLGKVDDVNNTVNGVCSNFVTKMTAEGIANYMSMYNSQLQNGTINNQSSGNAFKSKNFQLNYYYYFSGGSKNLWRVNLNFESDIVFYNGPQDNAYNTTSVWCIVPDSILDFSGSYPTFDCNGVAVWNYGNYIITKCCLENSEPLTVNGVNYHKGFLVVLENGSWLTHVNCRIPMGDYEQALALLGSNGSSINVYQFNPNYDIDSILNQLVGKYVDNNIMQQIVEKIGSAPVTLQIVGENQLPLIEIDPSLQEDIQGLIDIAVANSAKYAELLDPIEETEPEPVPDPEPVPGTTGTPVPDIFPVTTFDPIVKSFGSMFDVVSIFEPIFLVFGALGGLFAFWLVVPFVLLFMAIIRILK